MGPEDVTMISGAEEYAGSPHRNNHERNAMAHPATFLEASGCASGCTVSTGATGDGLSGLGNTVACALGIPFIGYR